MSVLNELPGTWFVKRTWNTRDGSRWIVTAEGYKSLTEARAKCDSDARELGWVPRKWWQCGDGANSRTRPRRPCLGRRVAGTVADGGMR